MASIQHPMNERRELLNRLKELTESSQKDLKQKQEDGEKSEKKPIHTTKPSRAIDGTK